MGTGPEEGAEGQCEEPWSWDGHRAATAQEWGANSLVFYSHHKHIPMVTQWPPGSTWNLYLWLSPCHPHLFFTCPTKSAHTDWGPMISKSLVSCAWIKSEDLTQSWPLNFYSQVRREEDLSSLESDDNVWKLSVFPYSVRYFCELIAFPSFLWSNYVRHPSIIMDSTSFHSQGCPRLDHNLVTLIFALCPMEVDEFSKWSVRWKSNDQAINLCLSF